MISLIKKHKAYLLIGYAFLLLIHFGIKDYFYLTGVIFYAFPLPILILGIALFFLLYWKNKAIKFVFLLVLIFLLFFWIKNYYFNHTPTNTEKTQSILFWNVAKQEDYNIKSLQEIIKNKNIDAILLVEANHKDNNFNNEFIKQLKAYHIEFLEGNMIIATKTKITLLNYIEEHINYRINHLQIQLDQNSYSVIIVDVHGSPFHNKKETFNKVISYSQDHNIDIIVGDFNTPYESLYFDKLKLNYSSLRAYQNGFSATWPSVIPLLELDQIWLNKSLTPSSLEKQYDKSSDHALLIGKFNSNRKNQYELFP